MNLLAWRGPVHASVPSPDVIDRLTREAGLVRFFSNTIRTLAGCGLWPSLINDVMVAACPIQQHEPPRHKDTILRLCVLASDVRQGC